MKDSADERSKVDRTKDPEDPAKDVREEYTSYRENEPDGDAAEDSGKATPEEEARREADLQPGTPESDEGEKAR